MRFLHYMTSPYVQNIDKSSWCVLLVVIKQILTKLVLTGDITHSACVVSMLCVLNVQLQ